MLSSRNPVLLRKFHDTLRSRRPRAPLYHLAITAKKLDGEDALVDCDSDNEQRSQVKKNNKSRAVIVFDTEEYLNDNPDSDEEMYDLEESGKETDGGYSEDSEDESYEDFYVTSRRDRAAIYRIYAPAGAEMSLLLVNRQIRREALPPFYQSKIFVFDFTAIGIMRFRWPCHVSPARTSSHSAC